LVGTTADFRRPGPQRSLPINHLASENRGTAGRIGELRLVQVSRRLTWFIVVGDALITIFGVISVPLLLIDSRCNCRDPIVRGCLVCSEPWRGTQPGQL
jgi:hypothetical protein